MRTAEARLAEIHAQRAELIEKRTLLRQEQAEQKKLLLEAVENMKKTKKWEAPEGVSMDIDVESLVSKVRNERSAGSLPALRPPAETDAVAPESSDSRPKSRSKDTSELSRPKNSVHLPHPPAAEKSDPKHQQVGGCVNCLCVVTSLIVFCSPLG
jgi:hypothetical protein